MNLEHLTDLLRPLPAAARRCTRCPSHVGDPAHTSHLAATSGTQHPPDRLIGHARSHGHLSQWFPLFNTLDYGCPGRRRDLEAEDQLRHEGGQTETKASDGQGQR
jgi:hypothetical protein